MRLFKRTDTGRWGYDVYIEGTRRRKVTFNTKADAKRAAEQLLKFGDTSDVTFEQFYRDWIHIYKKDHIGERAYQRYLNSLNQFILYFDKDKLLKNVTRSQYQAFLNNYAKSRSKETVRKLHNCISAAFTEAKYEQLIDIDPTYKAKITGVKADNEAIKYINEEDFKKLREVFMSKYTQSYLLLFLLTVTGARFGEIRGLTQKDIIDAQTLHIRGKKTSSAERKVMIAKEDMIYFIKGIETLKLNPKQLFTISHNAASSAYKRAQRNIGIDVNQTLTMHSIRHTHASELIYAGVDINYISERLGHANKSITLDIYTHLLDEHKRLEEDKTVEFLARKWHEVGPEKALKLKKNLYTGHGVKVSRFNL